MQDIVAEMLKVMEAKSLKPYSLIKDTPLSKSTLANLINRDVYPRPIHSAIYARRWERVPAGFCADSTATSSARRTCAACNCFIVWTRMSKTLFLT